MRPSADMELLPVRDDERRPALGCPLPALTEKLTPNHLHFVLNRFPSPSLDVSQWRLRVYGEVEKAVELSYEDLPLLPCKSLTVTLECAGNGRALYEPPAPFIDTPWMYHAVSNARWTGVALAKILKIAGIKKSAREVVFRGADHGVEEGQEKEICYERSLPLKKAMHADTLLAYLMNGEALPEVHGFPVRLIVPGWYGMASVKKLTDVEVVAKPFKGFYQVERYVYEWTDPPEKRIPATEVKVKSLITEPTDGEALDRGEILVRGIAWAGENKLKKVDVSTDGGLTWDEAHIIRFPEPYGWTQWEFRWKVSEAGVFALMVRATDGRGNTQPFRARWNRQGLGNNSIHCINIMVS